MGLSHSQKVTQQSLTDNHIKTIYIDPECPWQNGYVESFNSRFRQECLDREQLYTLSESRVVFADWRDYYNHQRPEQLSSTTQNTRPSSQP